MVSVCVARDEAEVVFGAEEESGADEVVVWTHERLRSAPALEEEGAVFVRPVFAGRVWAYKVEGDAIALCKRVKLKTKVVRDCRPALKPREPPTSDDEL